MNKLITIIIAFYILNFNTLVLFAEKDPLPKQPEVYLALRDLSGNEFDWYKILRKAIEPWEGDSGIDPIKAGVFDDSRIFILEEKDYWVVMIFEAGNGRTKTEESDGFYTADVWDKKVGNGNNLIFLRKNNLERCDNPAGLINYLPYADSYILPKGSRENFKGEK